MRDYRDHKKAERSENYWLYGKHPVVMALNNSKRKVRQILCTQNTEVFLKEKVKAERLRDIKIEILSPDKIEGRLGRREEVTHQGIAIEVEPLTQPDFEELFNSNVIVALDKITDPHNIGAIMRSAAAFGAGALLTSEKNSPPENATIAKISAGSIEAVPYVRVSSLWLTIEKFKEQGFFVIGLEGETSKTIGEVKHRDKIILVVGSEGKGLSESTIKVCDELVKINISEKIESLNASVAAAVSLYELRR